jgi:hypothetical protein
MIKTTMTNTKAKAKANITEYSSDQYRCNNIDLVLAEECSQFYADPVGWVLWAFDWGYGELDGFDGPDVWQRDLLTLVANSVTAAKFDGVTPTDPIRTAIASGHGIGKSAVSSWIILWLMSTRPHAKGVVTANTSDQLKTKTWAEVGKWRSRCIVGHWFEYNSGRGSMSLYHKAWPESWRVDAQTCREENSESFAGLHSASSTPFYLFDEASAVPEKIWEVAEGGLTDGEPHFYAFGNPTRNSGGFYDCFHVNTHRWNTQQIDSRTAKMTNKKLINQWANDWGDDSDFFRVRVLGRFPRGGDMQYIPGDIVSDAAKRGPGRYLGDEQLVCGIDLARGGDDDCIIQFRRGKDAKSEKVYRIPGEKSRDSMRVVSMLTMVLERHKPDISFVDVGGMGGPIGDRLRQLGYHIVDIGFGHKADDEHAYANKATEMAARCRQWLIDGGSIPDDPQLETELTSREYQHDNKDRLQLEKKSDMKKRMGCSPDWADALFLTFAQLLPPRETERGYLDRLPGTRVNNVDSDPLDNINVW